MHQTFWKPEKNVKEKKVYNSLQYRKPKQKKELPEWKKDILSHHTHRSSTKDRGEFPKEAIAELIEESNGICQHCKDAEATTTHHVMPRGRKGRGVKTNGLRLCWPCHDKIQTDEELLQYWISVYREKYGDYFWFDEQDWEEYNRKQDAVKASEAERAERMEKIQPVVDLLSSGAGRALKTKELRLLECFDDKEMSVFTNLMKDVIEVGTIKHEVPFGYGYFDD
ncbi:HNH endonuclease signature motif containing protein [Paenibacillus sp.]|jgi:hypothetical protein|uniref:HNH endonuclease n=1 Tax=Paenibacillus sp. TaxID=58172 RepID=UPI00282720AD|nr:HNH endonuclease signature motif containing protein [Paenibacillus sp.]MDR0269613.1 HNH endonuclease [Paenibacillus sp.]